MRVVVTGGCGFIGSHQVVALVDAGHQVWIIDDLSNADHDVVDRIEQVTGVRVPLAVFDVTNTGKLAHLLADVEADAVIHFAAFKSVPESTSRPVEYYANNVGGVISLLGAVRIAGVPRIVFSSSGSVYGETSVGPIPEDHPHRPSNPYSSTKSMSERILAEACAADTGLQVTALRYFNPAGAHPSGLIGENPLGEPGNLVPRIMQAAHRSDPAITVYGSDFDTPDGSGVRDYIHVMDVAATHLRALESRRPGFLALNVGRGEGVSVLQMIQVAEGVTGVPLTVHRLPRRPGDVSSLIGDTTLSDRILGPIDYRTVEEIVADAWHWQRCA
ncbi:MAG: UDP-glucose 4-epimerase GalE [Acidimicrobiales bacterium]